MSRIGIGLIGCGQIVWRRYAPMLKKRRDAAVVAVCTSCPGTARAAAARLGDSVAWMTDVDGLLSHPGVDAVIIATPHKLHARQAVAALTADKHVLLEKPMATTWEDAQRLIQAADDTKAIAMILPWEHDAQLRAMASCLDPQSFGRIASVSADFGGPGPSVGRWKYSIDDAGRGVIVAQAVYALDLVASIMGPAKRVKAFANTLVKERVTEAGELIRPDIDDNAVILLEYETGQLASVRSCWAYPRARAVLVVQGTRRRLVMRSGRVTVRRAIERVGLSFSRRVTLPRDSENVIEHFVRCIRTRSAPAAGIRQAAHVTEQMMLAYESVRSGAAQTLTTSFSPRLALARELFGA